MLTLDVCSWHNATGTNVWKLWVGIGGTADMNPLRT